MDILKYQVLAGTFLNIHFQSIICFITRNNNNSFFFLWERSNDAAIDLEFLTSPHMDMLLVLMITTIE